jgi:hypothetical protein
MSARARNLGLLVLLLAACSDNVVPITQIIVLVDSDLSVPGELDTLSLDVTGAIDVPPAAADLTEERLPRSLGLVYSGGPLGPITVKVRGQLADKTVVQRTARVSFQKDKTLVLRMPLQRACLTTPACGADLTCNLGECVSVTIAKLPLWDGNTNTFANDPPKAGAGGARGAAGTGGGTSGSAGKAGAAGGGGVAGRAGSGGAAGMSANLPPSCAISKPLTGDSYVQQDTVTFSGSCSDPESGTLTMGLRWESDRDGLISVLSRTTRTTLSVGAHAISLCATDPNDSTVKGCATVNITVTALPMITASIGTISQGGNDMPPFAVVPSIMATGSGTGFEPVGLSWSDSLLGALGSDASVTLASPPVGKHTLVLTATDAKQRTATDTRTFLVLEPGKSSLIAPYTLVNQIISMDGSSRVDALSSASISVFAAVSPGKLYHFDPTEDPSNVTPMLVESTAPSLVRDVFLPAADGFAYVALSTGYQSCKYLSASGLDTTMCTTYQNGGLPSNDISALVRVHASNAMDYLVIGSSKGLAVADNVNGSANGSKYLTNIPITGFARNDTALWIASGDGLYTYDLAASSPLSVSPRRQTIDASGPGNVLSDVELGSSGVVWVGSPMGLARFVPATSTWTTWHAATVSGGLTSLASNDVRDLAVAHDVSIAGVVRDIIWVATSAGVSRFDPSIPSFTTFTADDGLPSNGVQTVVVLKNGDKVFGTDLGLAQYKGP